MAASGLACSCSMQSQRPTTLLRPAVTGLSGRQASFMGARNTLPSNRGASGVCMMKKDLHPEYFETSKVYCNGEEVLVTSGTKEKYTVDIWSGNHPFFKGSSNVTLVDEGSVNRFKRRYAGLDSLSDMSKIKTGGNQAVDLSAFKKGKGKKKGKK